MDDTTELAALRAEVTALRAELTAMRPTSSEPGPISRRGLLMGLAGAGAAGVATMAGAPPASAADGDNLVLGEANEAAAATTILHSGEGAQTGLSVFSEAEVALFVGNDGSTGYPAPGFRTALLARSNAAQAGESGVAFGVWGSTTHGYAVYGTNDSIVFPAVFGINEGVGPGLAGRSNAHGPQLYLVPDDGSDPGPAAGPHWPGYFRFDVLGDLWMCVEQGTEGEPGRWTRLLREDTTAGRVVPIAPMRALDTRFALGRPAGSPVVPGQKAGPLKGGTSLTLDLAGVGAIPASATGVVGNLTVVSPTYNGYLGARPSGTPNTTSSINFTTGATVANAFTSGLGPAGVTITGSGTAANSYQLIVDITAYLT